MTVTEPDYHNNPWDHMPEEPTQAQIEAAAKVLNVSYENIAYSRKIAAAALTAAAEVGPTEYTQGYRHGFVAVEEAVNATIERCAQIADRYADRSSTAAAIAEDIRAMKDNL